MISQALATALFPSGDALGQVVYINSQYARVVGIIDRVQTPNAAQGGQSDRSVFLPMLPLNKSNQYVVRTHPGQLASVMRTTQDKLFAIDSHRIIQRVTPFTESRHNAYLMPRTVAVMLGVVSALLLAVTGFGGCGLDQPTGSRSVGARSACVARWGPQGRHPHVLPYGEPADSWRRLHPRDRAGDGNQHRHGQQHGAAADERGLCVRRCADRAGPVPAGRAVAGAACGVDIPGHRYARTVR